MAAFYFLLSFFFNFFGNGIFDDFVRVINLVGATLQIPIAAAGAAAAGAAAAAPVAAADGSGTGWDGPAAGTVGGALRAESPTVAGVSAATVSAAAVARLTAGRRVSRRHFDGAARTRTRNGTMGIYFRCRFRMLYRIYPFFTCCC